MVDSFLSADPLATDGIDLELDPAVTADAAEIEGTPTDCDASPAPAVAPIPDADELFSDDDDLSVASSRGAPASEPELEPEDPPDGAPVLDSSMTTRPEHPSSGTVTTAGLVPAASSARPARPASPASPARPASPASPAPGSGTGRTPPPSPGAGAYAPLMQEFTCPITLALMADPVMALDGHTYERRAIERWLNAHATSPISRRAMERTLIPNHALRKSIERWVDIQGDAPDAELQVLTDWRERRQNLSRESPTQPRVGLPSANRDTLPAPRRAPPAPRVASAVNVHAWLEAHANVSRSVPADLGMIQCRVFRIRAASRSRLLGPRYFCYEMRLEDGSPLLVARATGRQCLLISMARWVAQAPSDAPNSSRLAFLRSNLTGTEFRIENEHEVGAVRYSSPGFFSSQAPRRMCVALTPPEQSGGGVEAAPSDRDSVEVAPPDRARPLLAQARRRGFGARERGQSPPRQNPR